MTTGANHFHVAQRISQTGAALLLLALLLAAPTRACTLFGAAGSATKGGATLIGKNRDWKRSQSDTVRLYHKHGQLKYLGLAAMENGKSQGVRAGVNEKGLAVISATVGSLSAEEKEQEYANHQSLVSLFLSTCDSVDAALRLTDRFAEHKPTQLMLADREKVAVIEIAPDNQYAVHEVADGILCETNHYQDQKLLRYNAKIHRSSRIRLKRINELVSSRTGQLTLDDFVAFSQDVHDGPDDSILRTGGSPRASCTLATWIVEIPRGGGPLRLYVRLANPGSPVQTKTIPIDEAFWKQRHFEFP